jgi:hypothetical protein
MNGELAQVIALATHGTAWLRNPEGRPPALDTTSSTFKFVRSVAFAIEEQRGVLRRRQRTTLSNVGEWFDRLHSEGITRLWLLIPAPAAHDVDGRTADDHMLVAFAGAGTWLLVATGGRRPEVWGPSWQVGTPGAADNRIWDVHYKGLVPDGDVTVPRPSMNDAGERLRSALREIHAFSEAQELSTWSNWFGHALEALDADTPEPPYHPDMLPAGYPRDARRLLAGAAQAWVFGGMGSWNDLGFETQEDNDRYHELSRELYAVVLTAFVAGVNIEL